MSESFINLGSLSLLRCVLLNEISSKYYAVCAFFVFEFVLVHTLRFFACKMVSYYENYVFGNVCPFHMQKGTRSQTKHKLR